MTGKRAELRALTAEWLSRSSGTGHAKWELSAYQNYSRQFLQWKQPVLALSVAEAGLELDAELRRPYGDNFVDVQLRHCMASSKLALGNLADAEDLLRVLRSELQSGLSPLGLEAGAIRKNQLYATMETLAATLEEKAAQTNSFDRSNSYLREAADICGQLYSDTRDFEIGTRYAYLLRSLGKTEQSHVVYEEVANACQNELSLERTRSNEVDLEYLLRCNLCLAEVALVQNQYGKAEELYRESRKLIEDVDYDFTDVRKRTKRLLTQLTGSSERIDVWLPVPRVAIFVGHMLDPIECSEERFPLRLISKVKDNIREWVISNGIQVGFSSLASGADILFQEVIQEVSGVSHIFLPFPEDEFKKKSVAIRTPEENEEWQARFHRLLDAADRVVYASPSPLFKSEISFHYNNLLLLGAAEGYAADTDQELLGLSVWDGKAGRGFGGTASTLAWWLSRGLTVDQIDLSTLALANLDQPALRKGIQLSSELGSFGQLPQEISMNAICGLLFADAMGFSKLPDAKVPLFVQTYFGLIASLIEPWESYIAVKETWGDGLFLAFTSVRVAGIVAIQISQAISELNWTNRGFSTDIKVRIALHAGPVYRQIDPLTKRPNCSGCHVSYAARLEPKTTPNQVFASEAFAALSRLERVEEYQCVYVRQLDYAKHYGTFPTYVVVEKDKPPFQPAKCDSEPQQKVDIDI